MGRPELQVLPLVAAHVRPHGRRARDWAAIGGSPDGRAGDAGAANGHAAAATVVDRAGAGETSAELEGPVGGSEEDVSSSSDDDEEAEDAEEVEEEEEEEVDALDEELLPTAGCAASACMEAAALSLNQSIRAGRDSACMGGTVSPIVHVRGLLCGAEARRHDAYV